MNIVALVDDSDLECRPCAGTASAESRTHHQHVCRTKSRTAGRAIPSGENTGRSNCGTFAAQSRIVNRCGEHAGVGADRSRPSERIRRMYYQHLAEEGLPFRQSIVQGSLERLSPILMTALVTGVGLIPLALGAGQPGKEIQQPMAVVILGGIVTSTFLNMIVIPPLYMRYGRAAATAVTPALSPAGGAIHAPESL